ncbi:ubiquitin-like domain-containing CTD phosphatase 1 [Artemia franciscana]|uniref:Ubiquitin-like domain-containing CTD phosphatase 1 n=1 Tax=Artemia franciscana TaxID=6661 RepID=A0AA88HWX7_ARTSF|nr:hypothetical protein QYM36_006921 [Artemia franciscana]KAK2716599.1 hypothetical protein QYM36_006921 [Artemia franciscana]KAK2716600.1 hypothetical protein QYM36_006921 [Artemia franciscana]KAK2716601.1 hypothetical protein QYM36_006921 [Artemia franciscana]KAK2716602.1 hypothetical protein QYM36_006921 [Artemia franciscana]
MEATEDVETSSTTTSSIVVKWSGKEYRIESVTSTTKVSDLKAQIFELTGVHPSRQKLLNLKYKGKTPNDDVLLSLLQLKAGTKIMMVGSLEQEIQTITEIKVDQTNIIDDFDISEEIAFENREEYLAKVAKRVANYEVKIMNPPREGKRCLVLDIDYTLFDHRSVAECANELMRPFLHEFLATAYEYYDIIIWSATSMKWIVEKMRLLGVLDNPAYKIMFFLDSGAMVSVHSEKYGVIDVKPLGVIWGKYPQYGPHNTVIIDDLRRNFLLNPKNGLKIKAFRKSHLNRDKDRELVHLASYLVKIATLNDFSVLEHSEWYEYIQSEKTKR